MYNLICAECLDHFEGERETAKFCSDPCRLKYWRKEKKSKQQVCQTVCPNCQEHFAHKNPKKIFCTTKCKTAYHRAEVARQAEYDRYDRSCVYTAPLTSEEKLHNMLYEAWLDTDGDEVQA